VADGDPGQAHFSISKTIDELVRIAATGIVDAARATVASRGVFTIALSGGSTPRKLYEMLATPAISADAPWQDIRVFWGDERHVPPDHLESNYRMAREALLDHVPIPEENIHRIMAELPNADAVAAAYEDDIRRTFDLDDAVPPPGQIALPRFDLILLGIGEDGHTASLFPHTPALSERKRLVVANPVAKLATTRITLTVPVLNNAERVWFVVTGGSKSKILRDVIEGPYRPEDLPSQLINPTDGELLFLLDSTVAVDLPAHVRDGAREFVNSSC
jgi:6-phosphogluconolactonase